MNLFALSFILLLFINEYLQKSPKFTADKLKATLSLIKTPSFLLSSGTNAIPLFTASAGVFIFSSLPFK